jgi:lipase maturation factor 1
MTTKRMEIVLEGSEDGANWKEYVFRYKPGQVSRPLSWNIPHQPRLDWQMWFAALGSAERNPWLGRLLQRLLENSPEVVVLLEENPFPDKPPLYIRALFYEHRFSTPDERKSSGAVWKRELAGLYFPPARLKIPAEQ